jgi:hypothetical protein
MPHQYPTKPARLPEGTGNDVRIDLENWIEHIVDSALAQGVGARVVREIEARERDARQAIQRMRGDRR